MKWGLYLALVGSSLACAPWMFDCFGMVKVMVAMFGIAWMWAVTPSWKFRATPLDGPIALYAAVLLASALWSVSPKLSFFGFNTQPFYGLLALAGVPLVYYAVVANRAEWKEGPILCCAVVAIATGVACALEKYGLDMPPFHLVGHDLRAVGTVGSPVFMGSVVAMTVPVCLWLSRSDSEYYEVGAYGTILALFAMWSSGSRGPWLAAGIGCFAALVASGDIHITRRNLAAFAVLVLGVGAVWAYQMTPSDMNRYQTWDIALDAAGFYPFLGWGPDTFFVANALYVKAGAKEMQASAHNDLLQAWATTGLLGLLAHVLLWWKALSLTFFDAKWDYDDGRSAAIFGSLVALCVSAKFNPVPPSAFYLAAALVGSVGVMDARRPLSRYLWGAGVVLALILPGTAASLFVLDGKVQMSAHVK